VGQDEHYEAASAEYSEALKRLARAYEADADKRLDLLQEIHLALWRSFAKFEERCSVRTWVYRVAHNTAASHVLRQRRMKLDGLIGLDEAESVADLTDHERKVEQRMALQRLMYLIHRLRPLDRQVMLLYLEGMDAASIADISGISSNHVRILIHRIKNILAERFHEAKDHES
jgi:RNA polymerase sigma-70 factor, ECF subfamily